MHEKSNAVNAEKVRITVFTATYNRGNLIERLYHTLQKQTYHDFEWIVVDDGSQDDTELRFDSILMQEDFFSIRYIKTPNGGKHRAINRGVQMAKGDLFFIVDSDDYLTNDALLEMDRIEKTIPEECKTQFAGVCGLKGYSETEIIGRTFEGDVLDITMLERLEHGIDGDKSESFYTDVLRRYPFPEFAGENFITECVVWDKIAFDGLKLRFYNHISTICHYLPDGLSANGEMLQYRNPKGYGLFLYQSRIYGRITGLEQWETYLRFYFATMDKLKFWEFSKILHMNPVVLWLRIFGMRVYYRLYR